MREVVTYFNTIQLTEWR